MKTILMKSGDIALIDDKDYDLVSKYNWSVAGNRYARAAAYDTDEKDKNGHIKQRVIKMHRLIIGAKKNEFVDHINGNGFDNRRENLRICTMSQNMCNQKKSSANKSGYKGVIAMVGKNHEKRNKKWLSYININKKRIYGGYFFTKEEAAEKYNEMAKKYHGNFSNLNNIVYV
ncbi:MAG: HNH endonuclease [Candidatus Paceibacterota bacterium]|jgi:hypothetical protein